jgi:hypothetical protein
MSKKIYYRTAIDDVVDIFKLTASNRNKNGRYEQTLNRCIFIFFNYKYNLEII